MCFVLLLVKNMGDYTQNKDIKKGCMTPFLLIFLSITMLLQ